MARAEAREHIRNQVVWVYEAGNGQLASLVCVTRSSSRAAAITKVYTHPAFRKQGLAERLVRAVTRHELERGGKLAVVLFVAHGIPAGKVYHRVGFAGLCGAPRVPGVEDWMEVGFQGAAFGHW